MASARARYEPLKLVVVAAAPRALHSRKFAPVSAQSTARIAGIRRTRYTHIRTSSGELISRWNGLGRTWRYELLNIPRAVSGTCSYKSRSDDQWRIKAAALGIHAFFSRVRDKLDNLKKFRAGSCGRSFWGLCDSSRSHKQKWNIPGLIFESQSIF